MLDADSFVAPWNGTWDIETDVGFLNDGSITVTQTSEKNATITVASGLNGGTISNVKIVGAKLLVFRLKAFSFFEDKVKTVTFGLLLDDDNLDLAAGLAKVKGANHPHEASADLQDGTGPTGAVVSFASITNKDKKKHFLTIGLANFGPAAVPREGFELLIIFGDDANNPQTTLQLLQVDSQGLVANATGVVAGHTTLRFWFGPMLSVSDRPFLRLHFAMPEGWDRELSVAIWIVDEAGGPFIPKQAIFDAYNAW